MCLFFLFVCASWALQFTLHFSKRDEMWRHRKLCCGAKDCKTTPYTSCFGCKKYSCSRHCTSCTMCRRWLCHTCAKDAKLQCTVCAGDDVACTVNEVPSVVCPTCEPLIRVRATRVRVTAQEYATAMCAIGTRHESKMITRCCTHPHIFVWLPHNCASCKTICRHDGVLGIFVEARHRVNDLWFCSAKCKRDFKDAQIATMMVGLGLWKVENK